jgi:hypothetical protein
VIDARREHVTLPRRAGASMPSSCVTTSRSPSRPVRRDAGATCCHENRKRMNSAGADRRDFGAQAGSTCSGGCAPGVVCRTTRALASRRDA